MTCPRSHSQCIKVTIYAHLLNTTLGSQAALVVKNLPANAGDLRDPVSIPESGRPPGEGNGNPLQYSCLENPMDRGAWWVTVPGIAESDTMEQLSIHILVLALNVPYSHPKETWMVDQPIQRFESRQSNVQMVFLNPACTFHFNHCHLGGEVWYDMISITHDWSKPILYYPVVLFITDPMKLNFAS